MTLTRNTRPSPSTHTTPAVPHLVRTSDSHRRCETLHRLCAWVARQQSAPQHRVSTVARPRLSSSSNRPIASQHLHSAPFPPSRVSEARSCLRITARHHLSQASWVTALHLPSTRAQRTVVSLLRRSSGSEWRGRRSLKCLECQLKFPVH